MDKIKLISDLGKAIACYRADHRLSAVDVAARAGRSRTVLHKLEHGQDVTVSSLLAILASMGLCITLEKAGMPTLADMQRRFAEDEFDGGDETGGDGKLSAGWQDGDHVA
jgi:ribosome-binding protein aMBF1 (putative translation factor)